MAARQRNGWVELDYDGPSLAATYMAVVPAMTQLVWDAEGEDSPFQPAFLDWNGETRVAKVRPLALESGRTYDVWMLVDGVLSGPTRL